MARPDPPRRSGAVAAAALCALAAAAPVRAAGAPAPCALLVAAEPERLEATTPRQVRLRVGGPGGAALGRPRLTASAGTIGGLQPDGAGWVATWQAPDAGVPRVALLGALAPGEGACGFAAVPLIGVGDAVVRTRPGAVVAVTIAGRSFGPARADASGVALVPVEVPPGVDAAYHGARRIPLELPQVTHAALLLGEDAAPADRPVEVAVLVFAVTAEGAPRQGPAPTLTASVGALLAPEPAGPGAWRTRWRLPPGPAGEAVLTASLPGDAPVQVRLRRLAGPPATARLTLDRPRAVADPASPVVATVTLADAAGNPASGELSVQADAGEVGPPEQAGAGAYRLRWTMPAHLDGRRAAQLGVRSGAAAARASLALEAGPPAHLSLEPPGEPVTADGSSSVDLLVTVTDANGNPVDEPPVHRTARAGALGPPRQAGPGRFALAYRPPRAAAPGLDEVVVDLPPLTARAQLALRPPVPPLAAAASAGAALGPGGRVGLQAGGELSAWRRLGGQEAGLALAAAFTRLRDERPVASGGATVPFTGELRTLALLLSACWRRASSERVALRAGAGGGLARVESLVAAGGGPLLPSAAWVPAASGAVAAGLRLGPGRAFLEARATWLGDPRLASLRGSLSPLSLSLGYELDAP